jgi:hypothetical protein
MSQLRFLSEVFCFSSGKRLKCEANIGLLWCETDIPFGANITSASLA